MPAGHLTAESETRRAEWQRRLVRTPSLWAPKTRTAVRATIRRWDDVAALWAAYLAATTDSAHVRLMNAILLHEVDGVDGTGRPLERRRIELAAEEPLIRQGRTVQEMYVVLSASAPLTVVRSAADAAGATQVATLLEDATASIQSPLQASIGQLLRFLTGDSYGSLDGVNGLSDQATPAECVEALRTQVDEAFRAGGLPPDLVRYLANVVTTVGCSGQSRG